jgi:hypothetical protein
MVSRRVTTGFLVEIAEKAAQDQMLQNDESKDGEARKGLEKKVISAVITMELWKDQAPQTTLRPMAEREAKNAGNVVDLCLGCHAVIMVSEDVDELQATVD